MMIFKNLIMFLMLISITVILLTGCAKKSKPIKEHRLIVNLVKQVVTKGLDF